MADAGNGCMQPDGGWLLSHDGGAVPTVDQPLPAALRIRQIGMAEGTGHRRAVACRRLAGNAARGQWRRFPQSSLCAGMSGCRGENPVEAAARATLWRPY